LFRVNKVQRNGHQLVNAQMLVRTRSPGLARARTCFILQSRNVAQHYQWVSSGSGDFDLGRVILESAAPALATALNSSRSASEAAYELSSADFLNLHAVERQ
jgi:hypothetical protein